MMHLSYQQLGGAAAMTTLGMLLLVLVALRRSSRRELFGIMGASLATVGLLGASVATANAPADPTRVRDLIQHQDAAGRMVIAQYLIGRSGTAQNKPITNAELDSMMRSIQAFSPGMQAHITAVGVPQPSQPTQSAPRAMPVRARTPYTVV